MHRYGLPHTNQVEADYGGYAWTQWMHRHFGDTALHIALKWERHRAVKAVLSLRPDWTIRNEAGVTAEQLVLRIYGKGMAQFKDEQEREYENDAMRAEEEAMRRRGSRSNSTDSILFAAADNGRDCSQSCRHGEVEVEEVSPFADERGERSGLQRARGPDTAQSDAASVDTDEQEEQDGGDLFFDSSSAIGSGRWPCADDAGRMSPVSTLLSTSPPVRGTRAERSTRGGGRSTAASIAAGNNHMLTLSESIRGGGGKAATSPGRFDRSSRMSTMRTTRILAAGKSLRRPTAEDRLQRKMAARSAARARPTRPPPSVVAAEPVTPPALTGSPRTPMLPAPLIVSQQNTASTANGGGGGGGGGSDEAAASDGGRATVGAGRACVGSNQDRSPVQTHRGAGSRGGASTGAAEGNKANGSGVSATSFVASGGCGGGSANLAGSFTESRRSRSPCNTPTNNNDDEGNIGGSESGPRKVPAEEGRASCGPPGTPGSGRTKRKNSGYGGGKDTTYGVEENAGHPSPPQVGYPQPQEDGSRRGLSRPTTPGSDGRVGDTLHGLREGAVRNVLEALLTSTVMTEDGRRVLTPSFPSMSALRELKYCGPLEPRQASALERVLFARPGVLVHLSLPGKRIGDGGAAAIAPALPGIRSVDLRSNNIGDAGTVAVASALRGAAAVAATTTAAVLRSDEGEGGARRLPCTLETLSLAGNRIGDVGAAALGRLLEDEDVGRERAEKSGHGGQEEEMLEKSSAQSPFPGRRPRGYLGWVSVAGNPGISSDGRERLLRAGWNHQRSCRADEKEDDPPPMVIIV
eukprot:g9728.t1